MESFVVDIGGEDVVQQGELRGGIRMQDDESFDRIASQIPLKRRRCRTEEGKQVIVVLGSFVGTQNLTDGDMDVFDHFVCALEDVGSSTWQ